MCAVAKAKTALAHDAQPSVRKCAVQGAHGSSSDCMSTPSGSKSRRRPRSADGGPPRHTAVTPASRHALRLRLKIVHASRCGRHSVVTNCTERAAAAIAAAAADDDDDADAAVAAALPLPLPPLLPRLPLPVLLLRSLRRLLVAAAASVKLCAGGYYFRVHPPTFRQLSF